MSRSTRLVALAGGVGGAKLAHGLHRTLAPGSLTVVVNTGDDFDLHGLRIWPDHDTVMYTLAGLANRVQGWGLDGETWAAQGMLATLGAETWFQLGDRDLGVHVLRTAWLRDGFTPTEVALRLQDSLGSGSPILPMTDADVRTEVLTDDGWLEFQEYFVHRHQEPEVRDVRFRGIEAATPSAAVLAALAEAEAIVIAPSNPIVSVGPILAVPGMGASLAAAKGRGVPVAAVSPIVGGKALKGPADRMLTSLGHESSALGVARGYAGLVDVFVLDTLDAALAPAIEALGLRAVVTDTVMTDDDARARLAREVLDAVEPVAPRGPA
jgi:LPPG:FO 2-phospho-L-lactate transferase